MRFVTLYRVSQYVMLVLAAVILCIDAAAEDPFALLHPLAVAVAAVAALLTVDRRPELGLARGLANLLAFGSVGLFFIECWADVNLALALGYWLIYLTLIKMFLPKTIEDDWYLFLLGLVEVVIGAFLSQSDPVGMLLVAWALAALWALGLFHLHREALRAGTGAAAAMSPQPDRREPYPGLFDRSFVFSSLRVAATTLALGGLIFLAMPRWGSGALGSRPASVARHLTGFSEQVKLGQIGEILENDAVVMSVELYDNQGRRVAPADETLWRGVVMIDYNDGLWSRQDIVLGPLVDTPIRNRKVLRQRIKLEPTDSPVLFAKRPILRVIYNGSDQPGFNSSDGTLFRADPEEARRAAMEYEVISADDDDPDQPGEGVPEDPAFLNRSLVGFPRSPAGLRTRLRAIAESVVGDIPADQTQERANRLEAYLRYTGGFSYTLKMDRVDPSLDPVEDFLVHRKEGHCEYYASALTLLLRSVGIPARLVNGFKGGDWNELGRVLVVRQKHAHSWVEALVADRPGGVPYWKVLDPTPPLQREQSVAQVGGVATRLRPLSDYIRYIWVFYVVGFNPERQRRLIYEPITQLIADARQGFALMGQALWAALGELLAFKDLAEFFSVRGFVVSFFTMLLLVLSGRGAWWLWRRVIRRLRGGVGGDVALTAGVAFYRRLSELLAACGLQRPPAETPREFARRAATFLAGRDPEAGRLADIPAQVVDAYYRIRFGQHELPAEALGRLEARLDALEANLVPARSGPKATAGGS
jgi:protein-glutamine gamma-glutamyltransferase